MRFYFHPDADAEFDQVVDYYEEYQPGLGIEFAEEVYATIARIIAYPRAWMSISKHTRRCLVNRFPYGVIYQVKSDMLRIVPSLTSIVVQDTGGTESEQSKRLQPTCGEDGNLI